MGNEGKKVENPCCRKSVHAHSNASQTVHVRCDAERALIKQYAFACDLGFLFFFLSSRRKKLWKTKTFFLEEKKLWILQLWTFILTIEHCSLLLHFLLLGMVFLD